MRSTGDNYSLISAALEEIVKGLAEKQCPGVSWTLVAPILPWKKHSHFKERLDRTWEDLKQRYGKKTHFIPKLGKLAFGTGNEDVHLVDKSRERYFNHIIESSLQWFMKELSGEGSNADDERSEDMDTKEQTIVEANFNRQSTSTPIAFKRQKRMLELDDELIQSTKTRRPNLQDLEEEVRDLTRKVERRWKSDALIFAKHDEQLDTIKNQNFLDRIVFSGVYIENLNGTIEEKKPFIFEAITKILNSFMEDPPAPTFAIHLNPQYKTARRVVEIRFGNTERAIAVRRTYAKKIQEFRNQKKFPEELNGVNIGMTLTKSTRIRIAILKGLAKIVNTNTENEVTAYCLEYQPQPMLKIVIDQGDNKKTTRTYGFTEAIDHVAEFFYINDQDLVDAYTLAGNMKHLEQKFVVLKNVNPRQRPKHSLH